MLLPGPEAEFEGHGTQVEEEFAPIAVENFPAVQTVQIVAPRVLAKVPGLHDSHTLILPCVELNFPGGQIKESMVFIRQIKINAFRGSKVFIL